VLVEVPGVSTAMDLPVMVLLVPMILARSLWQPAMSYALPWAKAVTEADLAQVVVRDEAAAVCRDFQEAAAATQAAVVGLEAVEAVVVLLFCKY
jgi:hypothetical protein